MTPNSFTVSWTAPTIGAPILQYQTQHRVTGQIPWIDNPAGVTTTLSQAVLGLTAGTSYDVRVHVWNSYGENFSTIVPATTPSGTSNPIIIDARVQNPPQVLADSFGVQWRITPHGQIYQNNVYETASSQVRYFALYNNQLSQINNAGQWYIKTPAASPNTGAWTAVADPLPASRVGRCRVLTNLFGINMDRAREATTPSATHYLAAMQYLVMKRFRTRCTDAANPTNDRIEAVAAAGAKGLFKVYPTGFAAASAAAAQTLAADNIGRQITRVGIGAIHSFESTDLPAGNGLTAAQVQFLCFGLRDAVAARVDANGIVPTISIDQWYLGNMATVLAYAQAVGDTGLNWGAWSGTVNNAAGVALQPTPNPNGPADIAAHNNWLAPGRRFTVVWNGVNAVGTQGGVAATARAGAIFEINYMLDVAWLGGGPTFLAEMFDDTGWGHFATTPLTGTVTVNVGGTLLYPYPTAVALHNLLTILDDAGAGAETFTPGLMALTITNAPTGARSLTVQKSDGSFWLLLWSEPQIQSLTLPVTDVIPAAVTVTISFQTPLSSASLYDPILAATVQTTFPAPTSIDVAMIGKPIILKMVPA